MKTVLAPGAPWPSTQPAPVAPKPPVAAKPPKKPRPNPRIFKQKPVEVDFFRETREAIAAMKRGKGCGVHVS